ncbi:hypothetical protein CPB86DRAFT_833698 [Serendipita vermifera]|nr:hypothetical protein CPB86DRAFT_833698 [Serendipita vermifera]
MQITLLKQTLHTKQVVNEMKDDVKILVQKEEGPEHKNLESSQDIACGMRLDLCQEGTRINILEKIRKWANEDIADQQIFWLNDVAGSGKSTIAATMAYEWIEQSRIVGRFFFTPNSRSTSGLAEFCETVGKDISTHHPGVRSLVQKAIQETTGPFFRFEQRFQRLVIEPLRACNRSVILVVDGLDNCDPSGYRLLIQQLMKQLPSIPRVKAFITSRPLATIVSLLGGSSIVAGNDVQIYKASGDTNDPDIHHYVRMNTQLQHLADNERE